ncbi:MAG TPA: TIM44-like domain-containing protein [Thermoguttaceae bacterium]|nr:TIM44-like domain-containing protein [Thermoguttaceae bacterium]
MRRASDRRGLPGGPTARWLLLLVAVLACVLICGGDADARVGGGGSFSGGGGGGGFSGGGGGGGFSGGGGYSGGGGGGGEFSWPVFLLIIAVCIVFAVIKAQAEKSNSSQTYCSTHTGEPLLAPHERGRRSIRAVRSRLEQLRRHDPNFSEILFMDFACALYARVQEARGRGDLKTYQPYLGPGAMRELEQVGGRERQEVREFVRKRDGAAPPREKLDVRGVIVGGAQITEVTDPQRDAISISVRFETNYTEAYGDGPSARENTFYCEEVWKFARRRDVLSLPPEKIGALGCPHCGSTAERLPDDSCPHCGVKMVAGKFHWFVMSIAVLRREARGPLLTSDVPEAGTDLATVVQPNYTAARDQFAVANPAFSWERTEARFRHVFLELQQDWTTLQWERARPYQSDQLFQSHYFWIREYQRQGLRNVLEDVHIRRLRPVKIASDAFFDAITVRIWANMKDYTIDAAGKVVCGSPHRARRFTEYWTFIRRRGVKESEKEDSACPNCGAPLKINMAGICEFCEGKITTGEFDWVLSRIEQDEAYVG